MASFLPGNRQVIPRTGKGSDSFIIEISLSQGHMWHIRVYVKYAIIVIFVIDSLG